MPKTIQCPKCESHDCEVDVLFQRTNFRKVFWFGWIAMLYGACKPTAARCKNCSAQFTFRTVGSWIALAISAILLFAFAYGIYQFLVGDPNSYGIDHY